MKKLIGIKKTKTAVFISGKGSNLENLIKFSKKKNFSNFNKFNYFKYKLCERFKIF